MSRALRRAWLWLFPVTVVLAGCAGTSWYQGVGPYAFDANNPTKPDTHWHAALGVYDCDHWMGDETGVGIWNWPYATVQGQPARAETDEYAGLHSHDDGVIHMEPATPDEAGRNATLGRYFDYGGWTLSSSGYSFLSATVRNGDMCGNQPGKLVWATGKWDGTANPQHLKTHTGDPARYKLNQGDIVVVAFLPRGTSIDTIGDPPSVEGLARALGALPPTTIPLVPTTTTS